MLGFWAVRTGPVGGRDDTPLPPAGGGGRARPEGAGRGVRAEEGWARGPRAGGRGGRRALGGRDGLGNLLRSAPMQVGERGGSSRWRHDWRRHGWRRQGRRRHGDAARLGLASPGQCTNVDILYTLDRGHPLQSDRRHPLHLDGTLACLPGWGVRRMNRQSALPVEAVRPREEVSSASVCAERQPIVHGHPLQLTSRRARVSSG